MVQVDSADVTASLRAEADRQGDLLLAGFQDTYRNLTAKHLAGLTWAATSCQAAQYVLKTDDDQFVDTIQVCTALLCTSIALVQLPSFLTAFLPRPGERWLLCQVCKLAASSSSPHCCTVRPGVAGRSGARQGQQVVRHSSGVAGRGVPRLLRRLGLRHHPGHSAGAARLGQAGFRLATGRW